MKKIFFLFSIVFYCTNFYTQELPTIIPSTPDIMSFQKYGDIPVSYYTGLPSISIPIYSITTKAGLTVPISLTYHAGGIKVDEKASRTGLGWSLNAGGVISKRIIGSPDFGDVFPRADTFNPTYNFSGSNDDYIYALGVVNPSSNFNERDSGYDIYNFSFLGNSGKFFIDNNGTIQLIPQKKLKIEKNTLTDIFQITDEGGNQFYFNKLSNGKMDSSCELTQPSPSWVYSQFNLDVLLGKISTYLKEEIIFNYTPFNYSYVVSTDETDYNVSTTFNNAGCGLKSKVECVKTMTHSEPVLTSIVYENTTIHFIYSNDPNYPVNGQNTRIDFPGNHALRKIEISNNGIIVDRFELKYDYFNTNGNTSSTDPADNYRLKLTEVIQNENKKYKLNYNETYNLPPRLSYSQDMWGYYNGKGNATLLPEMYYGDEYFPGANREINPMRVQANTLTKIEYPTGGYSQFIYENNDYYDLNGETFYEDKFISFDQAAGFLENHPFEIQSNSIDLKLQIVNECNSNSNPDDPDGIPGDGDLCEVRILDSNNQLIYSQISSGFFDINFLNPSNYILQYQRTGDCLCQASISYKEKKTTPPGNIVSGGLRIAEIINFDGKNITETFYKYNKNNSTESSGIVQGKPDMFSIIEDMRPSQTSSVWYSCKYLVRNSSNLFPVAVTGNTVGYSNITEYKKSESDFGRTEFEFTNFGTGFPTGFFNNLITIQPDETWKKGLLLKTLVFNAANDTLSKLENKYEYDNFFSNRSSNYYDSDKLAAGFSIRLLKNEVRNGLLIDPAEFNWNYYFLKSSWVKLIQNKKTDFFSDFKLETVTDFYFDNPEHMQTTHIKTIDSKGRIIDSKTTYPQDGDNLNDLSVNEQTAINNLITEHRIKTPIQVETTVFDTQNVELSKTVQRTNFYKTLDGLTLPKDIETLKGDNISDLEPRIIYHDYDKKGNPIEVSKADGTHIVYIWGYNETYPIAKIENASATEVNGYVANLQALSDADNDRTIGSSGNEGILRDELNNLRVVLPKSMMISTYTYDPLIGVTSITDPRGYTTYYEYDEFNRLKMVKDADGNIVSKNEYNYKN